MYAPQVGGVFEEGEAASMPIDDELVAAGQRARCARLGLGATDATHATDAMEMTSFILASVASVAFMAPSPCQEGHAEP